MRVVFLDTVGLIALWDEDDQWHDAAETAYKELVQEGASLVSSTFVFLECGNYAAKRPYRNEVAPLPEAMHLRGELIEPTEHDSASAWRAYHRREAAGAGIVDHVSFQIMRRLGIREALTHDHHFQTAGFVTLF